MPAQLTQEERLVMFYFTLFNGGNRSAGRRRHGTPALIVLVLGMVAISAGRLALADVRTAHQNLVSEFASFITPGATDGRVEAIAIEGDRVYVGGTFTQIQDPLDGEILNQPYLFAYSKATGNIIRDFDPVLNKAVRALQTTGEGTGIFVGGNFTTVNGETNRRGLVKLDDFGDRVSGFSARVNKRVYTMDRSGTTLYIGGNFTTVSQQPVEYLAAIDTQTGALLPKINHDFSGVFSTDRTTGYPSVDTIEVTSDDQLMVLIGNFQAIDGISRSRLAVLELGTQSVVSTWNTNVFDIQCPATKFPQYINGIDIAPDDSYFVTGTTGYRIVGNPACDSVNRFDFGDLTDSDARPTWTAYTGGDSVYEVAATEHVVYAGGHFRWFNNDLSSNGRSAGPGAVERRGFAALDPLNGLPLLDWRSDRSPRGVGVFALEVEPEGLYMGDDTEFLNGFSHPRFKFLSITTDAIERPSVPTLPSSILDVSGSQLEITDFDGTTFGSSMMVSASGWSNVRGAMFVGGQLFHADSGGTMWVSALQADSTFAPRTQVNLRGFTSSHWYLSRVGGMYFDHAQGRVYYTKDFDSRLFYRAFTPDGPLFGENEYIAENQADIPWYDVRGMDVIDGNLYYGRSNGYLYRAAMSGFAPVTGTSQIISGPLVDGRNWSDRLLAFSDGTVLPPPDQSQYEFEAAGSASSQSFKKFQFDVQAGEPITVRLTWDDPDAKLNVFLRDQNNVLLASDTDAAGSPKWLEATAGASGTYTVAVKIKEGDTAYTVSINPTEEPPEPLAEFEFNSSGSDTVNYWQVFKFDVVAGEQVDAQILWDNPTATLKAFLRDETNAQIVRDIDLGPSPISLTALAGSSGQWSVAVRITSGETDYSVLVDTQ